MFEGNFVEMCTAYFPLMIIGEEQTVKRAQMRSEDPHRPEQTFFIIITFLFILINIIIHIIIYI
jgi:hypothetical protein